MLIIAFLLALSALVIQGIAIPHLGILAFGPFLALLALRTPLAKALWLSALSGVLMDLFSDDPMGLHALNYTLTVFILFQIRKPFLFDHPFHYSLFTAFLSFFSTLFQLILLFLFDRRVPFDGRWIFGDLLAMPVIDALYAFVWFTAPLTLWENCRRKWVLFWLKRKNLSPTSR